MRAVLVATAALLTVACSANRAALRPVEAPPAAVAVAPAPVSGPMSARAFAERHGLTYQDQGSHVLLSSASSRVRLYPGSNRVSVDGQELSIRGHVTREGGAVVLPGPAVSFLGRRLDGARARRAARDSVVTASAPVAPPPRSTKPRKPRTSPRPATSARAQPVVAGPGWVPASTQRDWHWIVLHHSDDTSGNAEKYHRQHLAQNWENGLGYHFVIGNGTLSGDGEVEVGPRWTQQIQGAHAKTPDNAYNERGVGICLVGDFERGGRPTSSQMDSLARLCRWLMIRYDIPSERVIGHCDCKPTACPGKHFPWAELRARLR
jgi:hypothetical protein